MNNHIEHLRNGDFRIMDETKPLDDPEFLEFQRKREQSMLLKDPNYEHNVKHNANHKQWIAGQDKDGTTYIEDQNFEYDARLYINGDFLDMELKLRYAQAIADILNQANEQS